MTLQDQMAADLANVFLNTAEFAVAVTYQPSNGGGQTFATSLVLADVAEQIAQVPSGNSELRRVEAIGVLAVIRTGIGNLESSGARDPDRGDLVTIAAGAYAGTWVVELPGMPDVGGGVKLTMRRDTRYEAAAPGAVSAGSA